MIDFEKDFEKKIRQLIYKYALLELLFEFFETSPEMAQHMRRICDEAEKLSSTVPLTLAQRLIASAVEEAFTGRTGRAVSNVLEVLRNPPCSKCLWWNSDKEECQGDVDVCLVDREEALFVAFRAGAKVVRERRWRMSYRPFDNKPCPACGERLRYSHTGIGHDSYYDCYECPSGHRWLDFFRLGEHKLERMPEVFVVEGGEECA